MLRLLIENTLDREERIMAEWQRVRLGNIIKTNQNIYSTKESWQFVNYLDTGNITMNRVKEIRYINTDIDKLPSRARRKVKFNSIIYSTVRPDQLHYGIIKEQPDNFLISTGFTVIDVDSRKAVPDFIYYILTRKDVTEHLQAIAEQSVSAYPSLKPSDIENLKVLLPDVDTQKKIVSVLSVIDEKIALNTQINNNLEQHAVAVFNKFYDTSTNQQPFTTLINVLGGGTPKTGNPEFWDGSIPFFTPKDVGTPYTFKTEKYITESGLKHCNSRLYPQNTTFVTARGTVGKISLAGSPMAMNQSCYALASEIVDPLLVYFYVLKAVTSLKHKASGAVFDAIVTRDFDGEMINILSDTDSESALSIIKPMMEAIHNNSKENMRLSAVRDALLPKLISGEIDVSSLDI